MASPDWLNWQLFVFARKVYLRISPFVTVLQDYTQGLLVKRDYQFRSSANKLQETPLRSTYSFRVCVCHSRKIRPFIQSSD